ncbi:MAG: IS5 family transposase [Acidimicrobiales bacterium]
MPSATQPRQLMEASAIMRALDPEVVDAVWTAIEPMLPVPADSHPLGCHNPRLPDRVCFEGILIRLALGCSWQDAERLIGHRVSDTTLRARRDEWITAGVFDALADHALAAYDRIITLDLSETAVDGSQHKAPCGGEGTGRNPTDRGKLGWKWSLLTDRWGIPVGWTADGANRHDMVLFEPTLHAAADRGLVVDIETLHLDRGYDNGVTRSVVARYGIDDLVCAKTRTAGTAKTKTRVPLGLRWPVERTNSWLSNYGQLRRSTDRKTSHRLAQLALAITCLITAKLIDWRNRWSPTSRPTR